MNRIQYEQLARGQRTVWMAFDGDAAGQGAAQDLARRLRIDGRTVLRVTLPNGHDPASYFATGATAADFEHLLQEARL